MGFFGSVDYKYMITSHFDKKTTFKWKVASISKRVHFQIFPQIFILITNDNNISILFEMKNQVCYIL